MNPVPLQMGGMKRLLRKLIGTETTTQNGELAATGIISDELWGCGIDSQVDSPSAVNSGQSNCWNGNWDTTWGIPLWRANIVAQINPAPAAGAERRSINGISIEWLDKTSKC